MKLIDKYKRRITITSDMWIVSNQKKGHMSITSHYMDDNWTLQNIILRYKFFNL